MKRSTRASISYRFVGGDAARVIPSCPAPLRAACFLAASPGHTNSASSSMSTAPLLSWSTAWKSALIAASDIACRVTPPFLRSAFRNSCRLIEDACPAARELIRLRSTAGSAPDLPYDNEHSFFRATAMSAWCRACCCCTNASSALRSRGLIDRECDLRRVAAFFLGFGFCRAS
jgi:hypothetical protein